MRNMVRNGGDGVTPSKCDVAIPDYFSSQQWKIPECENVYCSMTSEIWLKIVDEIKKKNFIYRGEGNDSVVIALPKLKKVLRVKKIPCDHLTETQISNHATLLRQVYYTKMVMLPLLGSNFIDVPDLLCLQVPHLKTLSSSIESFRPAERIHKTIDVSSAHAILMSDACLFNHHGSADPPTIAIEIKPKQGFLPPVAKMDDDIGCQNQIRMKSICRYSIKQVCKMRKKVINQESDYCPVDLFSGCPKRMNKALMGLLKNPQNNLKIFKNGMKIFGQGSNLEELKFTRLQSHPSQKSHSKFEVSEWLCDLLIKAVTHSQGNNLIKPVDSYNFKEYCQGHRNKSKDQSGELPLLSGICQRCQHSLPSSSILGKVLSIQKLDTLDISRIYPLYCESKQIVKELENMDYEDNKEQLTSVLNYAVNKINEFLVSATAKDCSIIVKFVPHTKKLSQESKINEDCFIVQDLNEMCFLVSVKVVDLDIKSSERIEKYYKKNKEMQKLI